ncbi:MAG: AMP-binding enzyme [Flavobacteriales bacterium Tduv]
MSHIVGLKSNSTKSGSVWNPVCAYHMHVLKKNERPARSNEKGYIDLKRPLPPGTLFNLWRTAEKFKTSYLEKYPRILFDRYSGYFDHNDYTYVTRKIDDVINVSQHPLSAIRIEEVVVSHPAVNECVVVAVNGEIKEQLLLTVVDLKASQENYQTFQIHTEIVHEIRKRIGPLAIMDQVAIVKRLPKPCLGEILSGLVQNILDGKSYYTPTEIEALWNR